LVQAGLLLLAWPVTAQVRVGDLSSHLTGTIAPGYTADFGNLTGSDHTWAMGGTASLTGSFYAPGFLSYNVDVFLNQSRANSDFQSISNASGVNAAANIFSGSRFPGAVSYSKDFDSEGSYAVPGVANFVTHGNSNTFGVNWSESLPSVPSFSAGFQMGSSQYSVYGDNDQGNNSFRSVNLHSGYQVAGFNMGGFFNDGSGDSLIPQVVTGEPATQVHSDSTAIGYNVSHRLPLDGSASASITRSGWSTDYLGLTTSGTIDMVNGLAQVHPTQKLSLSATANYSDNLAGQLIQSVIAAGGVVPGGNLSQASNSLDLMGNAGYVPIPNLQTSLFVERRSQYYLGELYGVTSYGGSGSYAHTLFNGSFNASLSAIGNTADQTGANTLGLTATGNYSNVILGWQVSASLGYAQNVQTLLITDMNSFYNYSGNARRRWGKLNVSGGGGGGRTALTQEAGAASSSQSYNASVGWGGWINLNGSYSKSSGEALVTGAGLVPITGPEPPSLVSLFGGTGYSFGLSSTPVKHLILSASYSQANSDTNSNGIASTNQNNEFNSIVQYQYRKLNFTSGYARLEQGFSGSGAQPEVISSFYIGVSRWFNFF